MNAGSRVSREGDAGMALLIEMGIARQRTGKKRDRIFVYDRYLAHLSEGTEMPGRAKGEHATGAS